MAKDPVFVGIRDILDDRADDWILRDDVQRGLEAVAKLGLTYDLLIR